MDTTTLPILIIEDDLGLNELLCDKVHDKGFETHSFYNASDALAWLQDHRPLMMLLDYSLPDLNGKEFILSLGSANIEVPPFVMATGRGDERIAVEMMKLGAKDYVLKDANFLDMISLVLDRVCNDIEKESKFKKTKKELDELSLFSNQIIESAQEGLVVYDKDLNFIVWNPFMEKLMGIMSESVIGKKSTDLFPAIVQNHIADMIQSALNGESYPSDIEFFFDIPSTAKKGWVAFTVSPLINSQHEIIGVISSVRDITTSKNAELALVESEKKYRSLIQNSPDAIGIYVNGIVRMVNKQCLLMFNAKSEDELIGKSVFDFVHPDSYKQIAVRMANIEVEGVLLEPVEEKFLRLDGSVIDVNVKAMSLKIGDELAVQLIARDITEKKKSERELAENRNGLKEVLLSVTELIETGADVIDYSKLCEVVRKISGAKFAGFNLFDEDGSCFTTVGFAGVDDVQSLSLKYLGFDLFTYKWDESASKLKRSNRNSITKFDSLSDICNFDFKLNVIDSIESTYNIGEIYVVGINDHNSQIGDFTLVFEKGNALHQTELVKLYANQVGQYINRLSAEKKIKESEKKYRILFADNPQPMMIYDLDTLQYIEVNQAAINHYGYTYEEFLSMTIEDIHPTEDIIGLLSEIDKIRKDLIALSEIEFRHKKKNGDIIYVQMSSHSIKMDGRNARHVLVKDITENKMAEKALQEKMDELIRFQRLTVDREIAMIELKSEINTLLEKIGQEKKYKIVS